MVYPRLLESETFLALPRWKTVTGGSSQNRALPAFSPGFPTSSGVVSAGFTRICQKVNPANGILPAGLARIGGACLGGVNTDYARLGPGRLCGIYPAGFVECIPRKGLREWVGSTRFLPPRRLGPGQYLSVLGILSTDGGFSDLIPV